MSSVRWSIDISRRVVKIAFDLQHHQSFEVAHFRPWELPPIFFSPKNLTQLFVFTTNQENNTTLLTLLTREYRDQEMLR